MLNFCFEFEFLTFAEPEDPKGKFKTIKPQLNREENLDREQLLLELSTRFEDEKKCLKILYYL